MPQSPKETAAQLRQPYGPNANANAVRMNEANEETNYKAIAALGLVRDDCVLEIGPGNGKFVSTIVTCADGIKYTGLDWSQAMIEAATKNNKDLVQAGQAQFICGSSSDIPFSSEQFTKILAVHTIYFWEKTDSHLSEIYRILKPDGKLCICFGDESFMRGLPFTQHGFKLYNKAQAVISLESAGFRVINTMEYLERGRSNTGKIIDKKINIIVSST
ncbi:MAG: class I SAM-dependent methyltransferase [Cyanobacteria bacterium P01_D01_bin.123]